MVLWRVLKPLAGDRGRTLPGVITTLNLSEAQLQILQERGAISPVRAPPLETFNGWEKRAEKLKVHDIITADQFLEAQTTVLAGWLKEKPDKIEDLKREVMSYLLPTPTRKV